MKIIIFAFIAFLLTFTSCMRPAPECEEKSPHLQKMFIGFYYKDSSYYHPPVDTSFSSVYAVGYNAEMSGRRIDNQFYLPVPAEGGEVVYVFQQGEELDTLALDIQLELDFEDTYCPPEVHIAEVKLLPRQTSYPIEIIEINSSYYYEASVRILLP